MDQSKIIKFVTFIFLFGLGIVVGIAIRHYYNIPMAETINIVDLAALVTTIFLAVYIPEVLDRQLQVKRDKKELIEERIEELQSFYRKINLLVQQDSISAKDRAVLKNTLDVCDHRLDTVIMLLTYSKMKTSFENEIRKIKQLCDEHKNLLYSEQDQEEDFIYSKEEQDKEEFLYNKIDKETCLLIFKISEA